MNKRNEKDLVSEDEVGLSVAKQVIVEEVGFGLGRG